MIGEGRRRTGGGGTGAALARAKAEGFVWGASRVCERKGRGKVGKEEEDRCGEE